MNSVSSKKNEKRGAALAVPALFKPSCNPLWLSSVEKHSSYNFSIPSVPVCQSLSAVRNSMGVMLWE